MLDVLGIGFGPSNLALAVALDERRPTPRYAFLEARDRFAWHPGMMLDGAKVQNSFVKDLVTLRNPRSAFSFLAYLKAHGRLHRFINLRDPFPTRWEFNEYFQWAARAFEASVHYGWRAIRMAPHLADDQAVAAIAVTAAGPGGETRSFLARNVVLAPGGQPELLRGVVPASPRAVHAAQFVQRIGEVCPDTAAPLDVAVVGGGQSGAEIVQFVHGHYPGATVHWVISGAAPRPADDNPFVNDIFLASEVDRHYAAYARGDDEFHHSLRNSNYGVADSDLLHALYKLEYDGIARGKQRLHVLTRCRLLEARERGSRLTLSLDGQPAPLDVDLLVLATGYDRALPAQLLEPLLPHLARDAAGKVVVERGYRLAPGPNLRAGIFVQGLAEPSHGLGDTLFPVLPFRSDEIVSQVVDSAAAAEPYPPARHVENRTERLHETIRRYPLATFLAQVNGQIEACHIPMILHADAGRQGELFGHLDATNPLAAALDGGEFLAIFRGPSTYISPRIYETDQLPTWNFVSVHVRGVTRLLRRREDVVAGLMSIPEHADQRAYRLDPRDPRIDQLIGGIVAFRFEIKTIEGRFKLSQDRTPSDRVHAMRELAHTASPQHGQFVAWLHDCPAKGDPSGGHDAG
jgi:L-ornithine N5-oxygenase